MTARSELFVTEDVRDALAKKLKINVGELEVKCPKDWRDIWSDEALPDKGRAVVYRQGKFFGWATWRTKFSIEWGVAERYIVAEPEDVKFTLAEPG